MVAKTRLPSPPRPPKATDGIECADEYKKPANYYNGIYYPDSDGEPLAENGVQAETLNYLYNALNEWLRERKDVQIIMDMFVYYEEGSPRVVFAPDIGVMMGVEGEETRLVWQTWNENGVLPSLIIETASPNTWRQDLAKRDLYARLGVPEYWRNDPVGNLPIPLLVGERLVNGRYEPIDLRIDESGILRGYSDVLKLDFCVVHSGVMPELRLFDPAAGQWLLSPRRRSWLRREGESKNGCGVKPRLYDGNLKRCDRKRRRVKPPKPTSGVKPKRVKPPKRKSANFGNCWRRLGSRLRPAEGRFSAKARRCEGFLSFQRFQPLDDGLE